MSARQQLQMVIKLSIPAILAQISSIIMQYIDAAMVGSLGADASAAIGLVVTTSWLLGGLCVSAAAGFSVQVAQFVGAKRIDKAKDVFRQSLLLALVFGMMLSATGILISPVLPVWLGGKEEINSAASRYFFIFSCALPATQFRQLAGNMLQCSGNMKTPSILNINMCFLDVVFNFLLIFPTREISVIGKEFTIIGAGLGVTGAALGTALAEVVTAVLMMWMACRKSPYLKIEQGLPWKLNSVYYRTAAYISLPIAFEHMILCGAQVALTYIIAPLGTISIAANSLGVTAESLCYMPGYGIGSAATTLVGQSIGAKRLDVAWSYARLSVQLGVALMTFTGILMFVFSPFMFAVLTPDPEVRMLGTQILRIEAFAEPLYAASIVAAGALLRRRAEEILSLVERTEKELIEQEELVEGRIVIGCGELAAMKILPEIIETFHKKYPLVSYDIFTANADMVKDQMEKGLIDIGVLLEPIDIEKFAFIRLAERERWVVFMRPNDPLAEKEAVSAKDLENLPLILPRRTNVQNELSNWFGASLQSAQVLFTSNLSTNSALMVQRGLAYSIAIEGSAPFWDKEKMVCRPLYPELTSGSVLAWKRQQPFSLATTRFIEHIRCFLGISPL